MAQAKNRNLLGHRTKECKGISVPGFRISNDVTLNSEHSHAAFAGASGWQDGRQPSQANVLTGLSPSTGFYTSHGRSHQVTCPFLKQSLCLGEYHATDAQA